MLSAASLPECAAAGSADLEVLRWRKALWSKRIAHAGCKSLRGSTPNGNEGLRNCGLGQCHNC